METPTKKETDLPENAVFYEDFISLLEMYEEDECSEFLHHALYYLLAEGDLNEHKQKVSHRLYFLRDYLNELSKKYLPPATQPIRRDTPSKDLNLNH